MTQKKGLSKNVSIIDDEKAELGQDRKWKIYIPLTWLFIWIWNKFRKELYERD